MKGIGRTILLLLCWSPITRWLLGIGLALTAIGLPAVSGPSGSAAKSLFAVVMVFGVITAVISPVLMAAVVFRSLSAPRPLGLIPNGRMKLLLGAIGTQLLLATFIGGAVTVAMAPGVSFATVFVVTYAALTGQFIGSYLASRHRFGGFWLVTWSVWPRLAISAFQHWNLQIVLATAAGWCSLLALCLLAWLAFAIGYLSTRQISAPHWNNIGMGMRSGAGVAATRPSVAGSRSYTRPEAVRTVLAGMPNSRRALVSQALFAIVVILVIMAVATGLHVSRGIAYFCVTLICLMAGPCAGSLVGVMAQHAKPLWLKPGLARTEVFVELESRGWRVVLITAALCIALAAGWMAVDARAVPSVTWINRSAAWTVGILSTPLVAGATFIYAQLQFVRGRRVADILVLALAIALWFVEFLAIVGGAATAAVTAMIAAQIILVPLLRALALRRWQNIDWMIHKGVRNLWGQT